MYIVYVTDVSEHKVSVFTTDVTSLAWDNKEDKVIMKLFNVCMDRGGFMYVPDFVNINIKIYCF